jgi:hypothetical protein
MSVAKIIMQQIKTLDKWAFAAWGAKDFVDMGAGLKFKTSGMTRWKGHVYVKYDEGQDLYNIDFFRIRGVDIKYDNKVEGVFAEDLVDFINAQVG